MNRFLSTVLSLGALAAFAPPFSGQTAFPPGPDSGCGVVTGQPVAPQIRLQSPRPRRARSDRGSGSSGGTVIVPGSPAPWPVCAGDIGTVIAGDTVQPSQLGISMNLLKDGFQLNSLTIRSDSACGPDGQAGPGVPVLETGWTVEAAGVPLLLLQQPQAQGAGNRLDDGSASFWWQGFLYTLQLPFAVPLQGKDSASSVPDSAQILLQAIAELAPGLDPSCFAQKKTGTWSDLATLGIGDPRPAIPAGYTEAAFELDFLAAPACASDNPGTASEVSLFALFQNASGGFLGIEAWSLAGSSPYPGTIQDGYLGWSNDRYQFSISGDSGGSPLPASDLVPIARRLDPTFSASCTLQTVSLAPADLPGLGFHAPALPAGWKQTVESLIGQIVPASCARHFDFRGTYSLFWSLSDGADLVVSASALRLVSDHPGPRTAPVVSDLCISWNDDLGTTFFVSGYSATGGRPPDRSTLVAVARSMDPGAAISP